MKGYEKSLMPQVIFGSGAAPQAGTRLAAYGQKKCLIITGNRTAKHPVSRKVMESLTKAGIRWDVAGGVPPEPTDTLCLMPTTSGTSSEMSCTGVITSTTHHVKFSFGNHHTSADMAIVDPEFTLGMPAMPTAYGAVDAVTHSVEMLIGIGSNEYTNNVVLNCIEKVWTWLPVAIAEPNQLEAREQLSWAAHNALGNGGIANGGGPRHRRGLPCCPRPRLYADAAHGDPAPRRERPEADCRPGGADRRPDHRGRPPFTRTAKKLVRSAR